MEYRMSYVEKLATEMVASNCSLAQVEKTADNIKIKLGEQQLDKFITALFKASHKRTLCCQ